MFEFIKKLLYIEMWYKVEILTLALNGITMSNLLDFVILWFDVFVYDNKHLS